jgi:hypothetical protein
MCDKASDPELTDYDITINSIHQENMFKGTITVCIVYAVFAFILIVAAYFSDNIRELLFDKFLPFTLIYIVGTIIIIMIFLYFILSFKPKKIDRKKVDENVSCPDYWKLEVLDDISVEKSFDVDNYNKKLFKYRCVMDDKIFDKNLIYKQDKKQYETNQYRLGNIPTYYTKNNGTNYTGIYDKLKFTINDLNDNTYLYKNINDYGASNLNYSGNKSITSNVFKDLRESALIMNNYKATTMDPATKTITKFDNIFNSSYDGTDKNNGKPKVYFGAPAPLTWATSSAAITSISTTATNPPVMTSSGDVKYVATVYDWNSISMYSLMNNLGTKSDINVYVVDTTKGTAANFIKVGAIKLDLEKKKLYFESANDITNPNSLFTGNNDFYFEDTYLTNGTPDPTKNLTASVINDPSGIYIKGPKVRLFNKKERPITFEINPPSTANPPTNDYNSDVIPLTCNSVYPSFLASKEDKYPENNTLRCAYAKVCNIPWSDMNCGDINLEPAAT